VYLVSFVDFTKFDFGLWIVLVGVGVILAGKLFIVGKSKNDSRCDGKATTGIKNARIKQTL
jgi:hypothetical protein